jgi:porphobilinogen synthase
MPILIKRPRRNRKSDSLRKLLEETSLQKKDLIAPLFILDGVNRLEKIDKMPNIFRFSLDKLLFEIDRLQKAGLKGFALFPQIDPGLKCPEGKIALDPNGLIPKAIKEIKKEFPEITLFCDIALDPYTSHGHDGVVNEKLEIDNDKTLEKLVLQSLLYAEAGCDVLAPSDMMDGRVKMIRQALEENQFHSTAILSYAAKYASALYSPFRDAIKVNLSFGNKKTYQMNPANKKEAVLEALLDVEEGADMLMVKPASLYLDVIAEIKSKTLLPIAAYHVSGEYAMVMAGAKENFVDPYAIFFETLLSIKRAGADFIFTYAYDFVLEELKLSGSN